MSALKTAYRGTFKHHPFLSTLFITFVLLILAWKFILWPRPLSVGIEAIGIHEWNLSHAIFDPNRHEVQVVTIKASITLSLINSCYFWKLHVQEAPVFLMLLTPHFKFPLAEGQITTFEQPPRSKQVMKVGIYGKDRPLMHNAKFMPIGGTFRLSFDTVLRSTPQFRWLKLPHKYNHRCSCMLTCSLVRAEGKHLKFRILSSRCGLSLINV